MSAGSSGPPFHYHLDGTTPLVWPGAVYDCDDDQCRITRKVIEHLAFWPQEHLDRHIKTREAKLRHDIELLSNLRDAVDLKARGK